MLILYFKEKLHSKIIISHLVELFVEFDGEGPRTKFGQEHGQIDGRKWPKTLGWQKSRLAFCHWCPASRIRGCGMVFNSTRHIRFTTTGHLWTDSGWSWASRIAHVTLHDCEVAPLTSQTLACAIFFAVCLASSRSNFDLRPSQSDSTVKILLDLS